ncbi:MAG: HAD-IC family P-type ATPase [Candidatus Pacebacteria bacterium]|nr:HAD-IC family P-type ATPase [Candidatus Paceibacterota bacterium]
MVKTKKTDRNPEFGLTSSESEKRLLKFGPNEINRKEELFWPKLFLAQFKSPLIYILFLAGLVTLFLKEWTDSIVIFLAVGINTVLGFIQEYKAEKSLLALKEILVPQARVIREGKEVQIEVERIVPGDLVVLLTGDKIPADGRLIEAVDFHSNEAILTGESKPVLKKNKADVFMGTVVASGRGKMLAVKTGAETRVGRIATKLSQTVAEETPLKKQISQLSKVLAIIFSLICLIIFLEGIWTGRGFIEMFTLSVAVAVAAIPEGLAVSLTVILTLGMGRILKRKGLVRKLLAAETLGSVDVIAADKTGTLTEGKMKVIGCQTDDDGNKETREKILKAAVLANNMTNPLELAMMAWARNELAEVEGLIRRHPRLAEMPFSSQKKFIAVLVGSADQKGGEFFLSGAPEMVMELSTLTSEQKKIWRSRLDKVTKKGLRVVAFAWTAGGLNKLKTGFSRLKHGFGKYDGRLNGNWQKLNLKWLGFLLFEDPVRAEVEESLRLCRQAGIRVKVITGDYRHTAVAVLDKLKVSGSRLKTGQIMEGWELEGISAEELNKRVEETVLFARTTPEQKIKIVEVLQDQGHSVAMMGDGVNDALALKKADIGVVVGEASEVAKETADMVLLDSNFKTIVAAVEEGRGIFENIKKVVLYLLADSFTEVILIGGSLLLGLPTPLLPAQILWVNLVEDGLPGLALAFEPNDPELMRDPPRLKKAPILDQEIKTIVFIIGLVTDLLLFGVYLLLLKTGLEMDLIRTVIFAGLAINSLFYVFSCKTLRQNLWQENLFSNSFLIVSVLIGFILLLAGIYHPFLATILKTQEMGWFFWLIVLALGLVNTAGIELVKWVFISRNKKI